jgi:competence protein ComEC
VPLVLLSHLHADHVDGLARACSRGRSVALVQSRSAGPAARRGGSRRALDGAAGVPAELPALGESRSVGDLRWTVLAPARRFAGTSSDPNNSSIVLRVEAGPTTLLLTGDVEPEAQRDLLRRGVDLRADVLKVPHHGSRHQDPPSCRPSARPSWCPRSEPRTTTATRRAGPRRAAGDGCARRSAPTWTATWHSRTATGA